jgi:hypothetical protein
MPGPALTLSEWPPNIIVAFSSPPGQSATRL